MYRWLVFLHILGAFGFMLAHGVSVNVMLQLRRERDRQRIETLLGLARSRMVATFTWASFLMLLAAGITLGFLGRWWGTGWIWLALGILIVQFVVMGIFGRGYVDPLIQALGLPAYEGQEPASASNPPNPEALNELLQGGRPWFLSLVGIVGWALILWLMMFKPF